MRGRAVGTAELIPGFLATRCFSGIADVKLEGSTSAACSTVTKTGGRK